MQTLQINQIFLNHGEPCIITKMTPKTIFIKPCRIAIEHSFDMNVMWETYENVLSFCSYLPEPKLNEQETKIFKKDFKLKPITVDEIINRVYKNGNLIEPTIAEHEAFINPDRLKLKYEIMVSILFY